MDRLLGVFGQIGTTRVRSDDDIVDKLNHRYTTFLLVIFAIVVSTKQYVGEPINCWCPAQFTDNHEDYTNKYCWVSNTYYVPPMQKALPEADDHHQRITYYQWVPLILLTQSLLFYLPCMAWRFLNNKAGVDLNNIVEAAQTMQHTAYAETRDKTVRFMAKHLDRYLGHTRDYRKGFWTNCKHFMSRNFCMVCGRKYGNYMVTVYIVSKLLYIANVIGQLFLLNAFLGTNYHVYGYEVVMKLIHGEDWSASERFPRVTLCDFHIRNLGNIHRHTVQCVLPINLFNEKIYIFVWFWFCFIALANVLSFLTWVARCIFRTDQVRYVTHHLKALGRISGKDEKRYAAKFVTNYLRQDGVIVLRLIGMNANELVVAELLAELYNQYKVSYSSRQSQRTSDGKSLLKRQEEVIMEV